MYTLFNKETPVDRGKLTLPDIFYTRSGMLREIDKVTTYYQTQVTSVRSDNIIARLIQSMPVQMHMDYRRFVDNANDIGSSVSASLQMTSAMYKGALRLVSTFYGSGINEILIVDREDFDVDEGVRNWKDLKPLRVITHPFSDLSYHIPRGNYPGNKTGFVVVAINIGMLMLQYRRWIEMEKTKFDDVNRTLYQFVSMYPLTNLLYSHQDICVFNRLAAIFNDEVVDNFRNPHPFGVIDYTSRLDNALKYTKQSLGSKSYNFDSIVKQLPMISSDNLWEVSRLPDTPFTTQVTWALVVARLRLIKFLLQVNEKTGSSTNIDFLNRISISLRRIASDKSLYVGLPKSIREDLEEDIRLSVAAYVPKYD